jgi:RND family efflux transporter MFP subunit
MLRTLAPSLAALALLASTGCRSRPAPVAAATSAGDPAAKAAPDARPGEPPAPDAARLAAPERIRYAPRLVATGTLKARNASPLALSVPGTLARVAVKRGQEVREGTLLAALDDGAASAARRQAEAAVAAARAQLALADDALARATRIREAEGVSEAQLFQARSQRDLAAAQLAAAEAQLEQAQVNHAHHFLRAPFAGVVTRVPDGLGVTVAPGAPVVTLVSTRALVLETSLTQDEAAELRPGARAVVSVPSTGVRVDDAVVSVVVPAVDAATNRVPVEITVPNADGRLLPNAFARAELPRREERDAWRVPSAALVQRDGGYAAWVAGADGKARALAVRVLAEDGDAAVVVPDGGAWPDGLRVVGSPPLGIADGMAVAGRAR